jgi:methyl coenzyme M reductase subunit C
LSSPTRRTEVNACPYVVGSGTVGPLARSSGFSGTSEIASVTTSPGQAFANRPPLMRDRCRRITFVSAIDNPSASIVRVAPARSSIGTSGTSMSALAPPVKRTSSVSSSPTPLANDSAAWPASREPSPGIG